MWRIATTVTSWRNALSRSRSSCGGSRALTDRRLQREEHVGVRLPGERATANRGVEPGFPVVEIGNPVGRRPGALVGHVVGQPRERVDRRDVRAHAGREQTRRDREVLVVRLRQPLAVGVGSGQLGAHHSISGVPARWLAARAITNRRSESLLT